MLKQTLIIATLLTFTGAAFAADPAPIAAVKRDAAKAKQTQSAVKPHHKNKADMEKKRAEFETRLKLTDEQKVQAKVIREKSRKEMKPVMDKMKVKMDAIKAVKENEKLSDEQKAKKIEPLKADLKKLKTEARAIREKNQKEFEAILTDAQKQEFAKMKAEGKKKYKQGKKCKGGKCHGKGQKPTSKK